MAGLVQAVRGFNDVLPQEAPYWALLEKTFQELVSLYGYQQIRLPILEKTALFKRSIGEVTDIIEKEMYTFEDRNGESLSLRPEGTASCVRAGIEHGLLYNQIQRLWYAGPMFRHERPQKGRYRQFYHMGVEAYGMSGPGIDAELIALTARLWRELGILPKLHLELNSLGSTETRINYRKALVDYLMQHIEALDEESRRRLINNPLRILDSKNPDLAEVLNQAPRLIDHLDPESKIHFETLCDQLNQMGIVYQLNPRLVRGLDYYSRTVFEWTTPELGAQATVCAGGRYDSLVELLGGQAMPAFGFALGVERVVSLLMQVKSTEEITKPLQAYLILVGDRAQRVGPAFAEKWRDQCPVRLLVDAQGGSFKTQFKRADKSNAFLALILSDDEIEKGYVSIKYLRSDRPQEQKSHEELIKILSNL